MNGARTSPVEHNPRAAQGRGDTVWDGSSSWHKLASGIRKACLFLASRLRKTSLTAARSCPTTLCTSGLDELHDNHHLLEHGRANMNGLSYRLIERRDSSAKAQQGLCWQRSNSSTKGGNGAGRTIPSNNNVSRFQLTERLGDPREETETPKVCMTAMGVNEVLGDLPLAARHRRTCAITLSIPRRPFLHQTSTALPRGQTPPSQHTPVPKPQRHRGITLVERRGIGH